VADRLQEYGAESGWYQCFVKGEFPQQSADSLISLTWCIDAVRRIEPVNDGKRGIGVDVARFGADETVIYLYDNGKFEMLDYIVGQSIPQTARKVILYYQQYKCPVGIDDIGVGGGVTDIVREAVGPDGKPLNIEVLPFLANERALQYGNYANKSSWTMWMIRELLRLCKVTLPNDNKLIAQLTGRKYKIAGDGQIQLESKKEMKDRGMASPDRADALAIAYWASQGYEKPVERTTDESDIVYKMRQKAIRNQHKGGL